MYSSITEKFADPMHLVSHFHLRDGDSVGDFGAGSGHFMLPLSKAVGVSGHVYAFEIQRNLVDALGARAHDLRLTNIYPVWCDLEVKGSTKLKDEALDVGILANVLFQFADKAAAAAEISRVMRKGGKFFLVEWVDSFKGMGPQPESIVTEAAAQTLFSNAGFVFDHSFPAGDHHYGHMYRKAS